MLAVVRVRGSVHMKQVFKDTLRMLRLERINHCVLVPETPTYNGMITSVSAYVTWGPLEKDVLEKLVRKRGRLPGNKRLSEEEAKRVLQHIEEKQSLKYAGIKPVFALSPPTKGYKSIKQAYPKGDLGCRGEKINTLLRRMI